MRLARAWHCRAGRVKSVSKRSFQPQWQAPGRASLEHRAWQTATLRHRGAKCEIEPVHGLGLIGSDCPVRRLRLRRRRAHGARAALARRFVAHRARALGRRAAVIWCISSRRGSVHLCSARRDRCAMRSSPSVDASVRRTPCRPKRQSSSQAAPTFSLLRRSRLRRPRRRICPHERDLRLQTRIK